MAVRKWRRRGKTGTWYVRLWVPVREHGEIVRKRVEHSTGAHKRSEAEKIAEQIEAHYHQAARANREADGSDTTVADAVVLYLDSNPNVTQARYLEPIVEEIGDLTLDQLNQAEVQRVARKLKGHCKPNTQARHVYVPISAVYNHAVEAGLAPPRKFKKPKGWSKDKRIMSPPDSWYEAVMPHLSPKTRALVTFLVTHGRRVSESLERTPSDVDTEVWPWTLRLGEYDKSGERVQVVLAEHVIEAIEAIPSWREQEWLFGTKNRHNIKRDIKKACKKAGVKFYGSHAWGRHKAARNYIDADGSVHGLQTAYGWKDPRMPMKHYGHEEKSEITERVHDVGAQFFDEIDNAKLRAAKPAQKGQSEVGGANLGHATKQPPTKAAAKAKKTS